MAFFFTFRRRSRSCLWCERDTAHTPVVGIPVLGKGQQLVVEHHAARDSIMIHNQCSSVVETKPHRLRRKHSKGALQARKPALLVLVAECPNVQST
jgi:hypothetical protein